MIDTIKAYQELESLGITKEDLKQHVLSLSSEIVWGCPEKRLHERAKFRVWVSHGKAMIQGSLCKLYFGNNLETLNRANTAKAIERLEELLGIPLKEFTLSRLDFSENIPTRKPVSVYIQAFEGIDKWKTEKHAIGEDSTGKYFNQSTRQLLLYDKVREIHHRRGSKKKSFLIDEKEDWNVKRENEIMRSEGRNFLRVEYRYVKNVSVQMKHKQVSPLDLTKKSIYFHLVREWFKILSKIQYREEVLPDLDNLKSVTDLEGALIKAGIIHVGGKDAVLKSIRKLSADTPALKSRKSRFAKRVKELSKNDLLDSFGKELFLEIRRKAVKIALMHLEKRPFSRLL